jgi:hypothetical protein
MSDRMLEQIIAGSLALQHIMVDLERNRRDKWSKYGGLRCIPFSSVFPVDNRPFVE